MGGGSQKERISRVQDDWRRRQWSTVQVSNSPHTYERGATAFIRFVREVPYDAKDAISLSVSQSGENAMRTDLGYRERIPAVDDDGEHKAYFHYHPDVEVRFADEIAAAGEPAKKFITEARKIRNGAIKSAQRVALDLDKAYPGFYNAFFKEGVEPNLKIRFLLYRKVKPGQLLGVGHYDRNGFTLALAESAPGLRVGRDNQTLKKVRRKKGDAIVMSGTMMRMFDSDKGSLPLSWHDIERHEDACLGETDARWAIIAMVHPLVDGNVPALAETHRPE